MTQQPTHPANETDDTARWVLLRLKPLLDDDIIDFFSEDEPDGDAGANEPWSILVVDDDAEVHRAVELALTSVEIHGRPLRLNHCSSAAEARVQLIERSQTVDLVLLDVVMETADAGLTLLDDMRSQPMMRGLPVLLHTGQPGHAPERVVRAHYDISGYLTKSNVTRQTLIDALDTILGGAKLGA